MGLKAAAASIAVVATLGAAGFIGGSGGGSGAPVAIPTGGPPGECPGCPPGSMIVLNYYDTSDRLVGQKWWGCEGQPPGSWGRTTSIHRPHFVPC